MSQAISSPGLLQGLCEALPAPGPYLCSRWGDQVAMIKAAPEAAILIFVVAILIGWVFSRYHYKKQIDDIKERLQLRDDQIAALRTDSEKLETNNEKLQSQIKAQTPAASSSVFAIEQTKWRILWRKKGETEHRPLQPELVVPDDAALVFRAMVRINSTPARLVENVVLYIAGNRIYPPPDSWQPCLVDHCEQYFYFDIPQFISLGSHKMQLIAECEGGVEERSPVFRAPLTRTYTEGL
jgi:hypothetical protein